MQKLHVVPENGQNWVQNTGWSWFCRSQMRLQGVTAPCLWSGLVLDLFHRPIEKSAHMRCGCDISGITENLIWYVLQVHLKVFAAGQTSFVFLFWFISVGSEVLMAVRCRNLSTVLGFILWWFKMFKSDFFSLLSLTRAATGLHTSPPQDGETAEPSTDWRWDAALQLWMSSRRPLLTIQSNCAWCFSNLAPINQFSVSELCSSRPRRSYKSARCCWKTRGLRCGRQRQEGATQTEPGCDQVQFINQLWILNTHRLLNMTDDVETNRQWAAVSVSWWSAALQRESSLPIGWSHSDTLLMTVIRQRRHAAPALMRRTQLIQNKRRKYHTHNNRTATHTHTQRLWPAAAAYVPPPSADTLWRQRFPSF